MTHKPSIVQNFPSVVSFQFPNVQFFHYYSLLFFFKHLFSPFVIYYGTIFFLPCHFFSHSFFFFFAFDIILSLTSFFHVDFSLPAFLLIQSTRFWFSFVFSGKKCCYNFFSCFSVIFLIFFLHLHSLCYNTETVLHIAFFCSACYVPVYINIPMFFVLTGSLNIHFKVVSCIL